MEGYTRDLGGSEPAANRSAGRAWRRLLVAGGSLAIATILAGNGVAGTVGAARAVSDLASVKQRGRLVMLCFPNQDNPMVAANLDAMREQGLTLTELRRPDQFVGIEVDILQGFAKSLGVELEIHALTQGYDALLPALVRHEGDVAASSLTITPKRQEVADFSTSIETTWVFVVVRRDSRIARLADLAGRRAAVMRGSSQEEFLRQAVPTAKALLTTFTTEGLLALTEGRADFTLIDSSSPSGENLDTSKGALRDLKVAFPLRKVGNGIAVRRGSDLLAPLDAYLAGIQQSGELQRIFDRHGAAERPH